jgi:diaminopimelate epimerase
MHFTKMQGLGNDYLYYYGDLPDPEMWARRLSDRHFGIGSDGIITISPSVSADFKMRIFNADGSEAMMCGNGIRCVGKFVFDKGYTDKKQMLIETLSGNKEITLQTRGGTVTGVTVGMGKSIVGRPVTLTTSCGETTLTPVSMGNPHAVCFVPDSARAPLETAGKELEHHPYFPGGVNVEFVQIIDRFTIRMRVWERGSGITLACGTGACASAAAAIEAGFCDRGADLTVLLDGGALKVRVLEDSTVVMTGPAETICECEVEEK